MSESRKQRIICVHTGGGQLRGSEYSLLETMQGFKRAGREVMLLCDQLEMFKAAIEAGWQTRRIPSGELMLDLPTAKFSIFRLLMANLEVLRFIGLFKADIIYCNGGRSCQSSLWAAKCSGIPIVVHLHAPYPKRYHLLYGTLFASAVIHVSNYIKKYHESRLRFRRSYLIVNGIDFDALFETSAEDRENGINVPSIPSGTVVLGFIGSLIYPKGVDILIDAVALLRKKKRKVFLLLGGKGNTAVFQEQVKRLNLEKYIHFLGEVKDRVGFYSKIDIHVLPSRSEAFGRTIVEAAACGKPSVAHNTGGIPEAMCECNFGELYSPNNPEMLTQAILKVSDNYDWRAKSGELSSLAKMNYRVERPVSQILSVFDKII